MQNQKETSISNFKMHTLICRNVHTITNLQNFHTYIQILQNSNRILDIMLSRKEQQLFFCFVFLLFPLHVSVQLTKWKT